MFAVVVALMASLFPGVFLAFVVVMLSFGVLFAFVVVMLTLGMLLALVFAFGVLLVRLEQRAFPELKLDRAVRFQ
jgi:hypothetical protein